MIAFYLHKGQREGYMADSKNGKKSGDGGGFEKMMATMH
jgi:hypothetical protein